MLQPDQSSPEARSCVTTSGGRSIADVCKPKEKIAMNTQAKVAIHKRQHPEYYCLVRRCLWRTVVCDPITRQMKAAENCVGGYCPRHKSNHQGADVLEPIRRAARTKGFFFAAMREHGVFDSEVTEKEAMKNETR
jgi:hypothetical protein